jgi:glyoxylase-like metal-dependent hydrolase (beta-lactamase superfamily II)
MIWLVLSLSCTSPAVNEVEESDWQVYALDYGRSSFQRSKLLLGSPEGVRDPFAWTAWVVRGPEGVVLIDTGFKDQAVAEKWKITNFKPVSEILPALGIQPASVTDVVLTHAHWDHMGNLAPYTNARVHIQADELGWARGRVNPDQPERSGLRHKDLIEVDVAAKGKRLNTLSGDQEILPGIQVHGGGGHTPGVQWVEVNTGAGTIVLASDIAYVYENLETGTPPGASRDPERDRAQIAKMKTLSAVLVPGHDPRVFERYEWVADRVVAIKADPSPGSR